MTNRTFRVIGRGRAGGSVALALVSAGWTELPALGRADDLTTAADEVELVVIATPDREIQAVASRIEARADTVVIHLSGSQALGVLAGHPRAGAMHPLMTLPSPEVGSARIASGIWFAVAGDPLVSEIAEELGGRSFVIEDSNRAIYHANAAVASNHVVALLGQVQRLAAQAGVPVEAYLDLVQASLDNVRDLGPADALTGPAARGDSATIQAHLDALPPEERELYVALARAAAALAGREL